MNHRGFSVEFFKFGLVGVLQNGTNLAAFAMTLELGAPYIICATVAASVALAVSFLLNRIWTFEAVHGRASVQFARYALVHLVSIAVGLGLLVVAVETVNVGPLVGQGIAIIAVAPFSYLLHRFFSFRATRAPSP